MHIAIIGIGGIGGYVGALLTEAYKNSNKHTITFIQRGTHGNAIAQEGLRFSYESQRTIRPHAVYAHAPAHAQFDVVIFCVKSKDLEQAAQSIIHNLADNAVCISLLNGVNNDARLANILPKHIRILNGCIYVSAAITQAGFVSVKGKAGKLYIGSTTPTQAIDTELLRILQKANLQAELSPAITTEVWKKYLFISAFATITSAYDLYIGEIVADQNLYARTENLLKEIVAVSELHNAQLTTEDIEKALSLAKKIPHDTPTSMQLDMKLQIYPEIDVFSGYIIKEAEKYTIPVPEHKELHLKILNRIKDTHNNG